MAEKKNKSLAKTKRPWGKYALALLLLAVVLLPVAYVGYQKYLDKVDADRFAALQSDFKRLQGEFNKIDPGWKYEEDCQETGSTFGPGQKSCMTSLVSKVKTNRFKNSAKYINLIKVNLHVYKESVHTSNKANATVSFGFDVLSFSQPGVCSLHIEDSGENDSLTCSYEAREMYFPELR